MIIKVRFCRNPGPVSHIIRAFTWSQYSHVEFILPSGYLGALLDGGVRIRPFDYAPHDEYIVRYVETTSDQANTIIDYAMSQVGKPYDLTGVFGIAIHRDWHDPSHWFCSELVCASFEKGGIYLIRDEVDRVTPEMLLESEEVLI